ncbi:3-hydroxyacyl-CoA dehydrogenase family protein [Pseudopedobacter beijingensis]|uniref:3-hydroxyacyl-CoA dehydrogenase family protein n=1 Tax=Pseudopedobacter beijingensis TaxID=1207056 RepID=A0ABW4IGC4_9SPHI
MNINLLNQPDSEIGIIGLGLMGSSIITSLLISGYHVKAIAPIPNEAESGKSRVKELLAICAQSRLIEDEETYLSKLTVSENYADLSNCLLALECVIEQIEIKKIVYDQIAQYIHPEAIIASNTSAIPISVLQKLVPNPARFMGIHWAEPAYSTRFLEITCGDKTDVTKAEVVYQAAHEWGKEPTLLRKDIRGFITNRLMYAVYREGLDLIESGEAKKEDTDKAFKYDVGSWITYMGIFKRMGYEGLKNKAVIIQNLLPNLSQITHVPKIMEEIVNQKGRGIYNQIGLYKYTADDCKVWEKEFADFIDDISRLAAKFPVNKRLE